MSIHADDLLELVIAPTLTALGTNTPTAAQWLLASARRSDFNPLERRGDGLGLYLITPRQHRQAWDGYLAFRPDLASRVRGLASQRQFLENPDRELQTNLAYTTAIAWVIHLQSEESLPDATGARNREEALCAGA